MCASEAVDLHEKPKNFLAEAEVGRFLQRPSPAGTAFGIT